MSDTNDAPYSGTCKAQGSRRSKGRVMMVQILLYRTVGKQKHLVPYCTVCERQAFFELHSYVGHNVTVSFPFCERL